MVLGQYRKIEHQILEKVQNFQKKSYENWSARKNFLTDKTARKTTFLLTWKRITSLSLLRQR